MATKGVTEGRGRVKTSTEAGMMEVGCIMGAVVLKTFRFMVMAELEKRCVNG